MTQDEYAQRVLEMRHANKRAYRRQCLLEMGRSLKMASNSLWQLLYTVDVLWRAKRWLEDRRK